MQKGAAPCDADFLSELARRLEEWFRGHGRRFPWREVWDPFVVLMVEFLLQRTRAETVAKVFHILVTRYGSPEKLSSASIDELRKFFSKLGLLYRAERLREVARELVEKHGGQVPRRLEELLLLKGVGMYIASATLNFGHRLATPVVDGNVMRVFNRLLGLTSERQVRDLISRLYAFGDHVTLAYALIDLGAMICAEPARCTTCPLNDLCRNLPLMKEKWRIIRKVMVRGEVQLREQPVRASAPEAMRKG